MPPTSGPQSFLAELRRRRVIRTIIAYGAAVFGLLQVADPVFAGLMLPDIAFRILVLASIAGFPIVAVLAWIYEITADGLRRTPETPAPAHRKSVPAGRYLQAIGAFTVVVVLVVLTAGAVGRIRYPVSDDGRVALAVFPFRSVGNLEAQWSEGIADLIATALDGTVQLRVVDPWSLWRPLRTRADAHARAPGVEEATRLAQAARAHRFLLGSVTPSGDRIAVTLRLYIVGRAEPLDVFSLSVEPDDLAAGAHDAAVRTLARVWGDRRPAGVPAELDFDATSSVDALKAYLAAKEAMRRGMLDSANTAIDRALALDSAFALAIVEAIVVKSWNLSNQGQPFSGFFELLERIESYEPELNERTRLRLQAVRASVRTDGPTAIAAARRILDIDPLDFGAMMALRYYEQVYGWQLDVPTLDEWRLAEQVVRLDSTNLPALAARAWWAVALQDSADMRAQLERIERADTSGSLGRHQHIALRALLATDSGFNALLPHLVGQASAGRITTLRFLRTANVRRHRAFLEALASAGDPTAYALARGESMRLSTASGWINRVDSAVANGMYASNDFYRTAQLYIVAADLAGVGEPASAERAILALGAWIPADSVAALLDTRPVWWAGWLMGAWHAQAGDTAVARRWIAAIGTLPPGGTSEDYVGSLQSDIEARLAARRGDGDAALDLARRAYQLWTIHSENQQEALPEPAMRLHLALQYRDAGRPDSARAMLFSLVPPTTWMGFLTARASFELGLLEQERGDPSAAAFHYRRALALWADGGPAVAEWADRVRQRLEMLVEG